jgi:DNA polymerase III epsilon subunit-like protein
MRRVIFADVETTTDDPETGHVWEIAFIVRDPDRADVEHLWHVRPPLATANPVAIGPRIGDYYRRCAVSRMSPTAAKTLTGPDTDEVGLFTDRASVACTVAHLLPGCTFVAANPAFDAGFLNRFLRENDQCPTWDYHLRDIGSLVTGYIAGRIAAARARLQAGELVGGRGASPEFWPASAKLTDMAKAVGISPDAYELHTALGDARLGRDVYDAVMAGER